MPKTKGETPTKKAYKKPQTNNLSILGLILAIFVAPLGLIISIIALRQIKKNKQEGASLAVVGVVIGGILTIINVVVLIGALSSVNQAKSILSVDSTKKSNNQLPPVGSIGYNTTVGAWDAEKSTDINRLYSDLETYHNRTGAYPSFADFNSKTWRKAENLPNTQDGTALCDPESTSDTARDCQLTTKPTKGTYSFQTWEADGVTPCNAQAGQTCAKYTLTAILVRSTDNHKDPDSVNFVSQSAQ